VDLDLKNILSKDDLSRRDKLLSILAYKGNTEKKIKDIRELAINFGLIEAKKWNITQILRDSKGLVVRLPKGWIITEKGRKYLRELGLLDVPPAQEYYTELRKNLKNISEENTREFLEEAIKALEFGLLRSAVVLSWAGAISILYDVVLKNHLHAFNTEAKSRNPKWKPAKTADDLAKLKEHEFLQILAAISIIGKNTKTELEQCLKLRNSCGHPSSLKIGPHRVASHIEILMLNVYKKFSI